MGATVRLLLSFVVSVSLSNSTLAQVIAPPTSRLTPQNGSGTSANVHELTRQLDEARAQPIVLPEQWTVAACEPVQNIDPKSLVCANGPEGTTFEVMTF